MLTDNIADYMCATHTHSVCMGIDSFTHRLLTTDDIGNFDILVLHVIVGNYVAIKSFAHLLKVTNYH